MEPTAKKTERTQARSGATRKALAKVRTASGSPSDASLFVSANDVCFAKKAIAAPRRARAKVPQDIKDSTLHLRLREGLKADATSVLTNIGISVPEAIRVFLGRIVSEGRFPFELEVPNAVTRRAMDEADQTATARFRTAKELFDDLDKGGAH